MASIKGAQKKKAAKAAAKKKTAKKPLKKTAAKARKPATKKAVKKVAKKPAKKQVGKMARSSSPTQTAAVKSVRLSPTVQKRHELLKKLLLKKRNEVVAGLETQMGRKLTLETGQKIDSAM